jgi:hypothetical protein
MQLLGALYPTQAGSRGREVAATFTEYERAGGPF